MRKTTTLIEIIIIVGIVTVLSGVAVVSISSIVPKKIEADARRVVSELRWLRERTIAEHQDHIAHFCQNQKYIEFYKGSVATANLISTLNIEYPITTNPSDDPIDLTFETLTVYGRISTAIWPAAGLTFDISIGGVNKVTVYKNTGCIKYVP